MEKTNYNLVYIIPSKNKKNTLFFFKNCYFVPSVQFSTSIYGEMAEWSKAAVLKTVVEQSTGGSNPSLSAIKFIQHDWRDG